jgi:hypothetical protein
MPIMVMARRTIGTPIGGIGNRKARSIPLRAFLISSVWKAGLRPERLAVGSVASIFQRGHVVFFALALEFFLGRLEACDASRDFFPLAREAVFLFGHAHPFS